MKDENKNFDWSKAEPNRFATGTRPITIRMDVKLVQWLIEESQRRGMRGYQTLAKEILEESMKGGRALTADEVRTIARQEVEAVIQAKKKPKAKAG